MREGDTSLDNEWMLKREAFREFKVTRLISTGNGDAFCAQPYPTRAFVNVDLGYGVFEGPSLRSTLETLPKGMGLPGGLSPEQNRARLAATANDGHHVDQLTVETRRHGRRRLARETRASRRAKRENKYSRFAALQEIARAAGIG